MYSNNDDDDDENRITKLEIGERESEKNYEAWPDDVCEQALGRRGGELLRK